MPACPWHVRDRAIRLELARFSASLDPAMPAAGLHQLHLDREPLNDVAILGPAITTTQSGVDAYVRGGDVIATYTETTERLFRVQVYWRVVEQHDNAIAAIEFIASVQTHLLDSRPEITTLTTFDADEVLQLVAAEGEGTFARLTVPTVSKRTETSVRHCYLMRRADADFSYAEMVHPADAEESVWQPTADGPAGQFELRHRLFLQGLEKGVILRARVLGMFVPREHDLPTVARLYAGFAAEEPPLTT